jgi:hypothetical protein
MYSIDLFTVIITDTLPGNITVVALETLPFCIERAYFLKTLQTLTVNPPLELTAIIKELIDIIRGDLAKSITQVIPFLGGVQLSYFNTAVSNSY